MDSYKELLDFGKEYLREKKIENGGYMYNLLTKKLYCYYENNDVSIDVDYFFDDNFVRVSVFNHNVSEYTEMFDYYYDNQDNKLSCVIGNCDNYEEYLQIVEKELEKLMM